MCLHSSSLFMCGTKDDCQASVQVILNKPIPSVVKATVIEAMRLPDCCEYAKHGCVDAGMLWISTTQRLRLACQLLCTWTYDLQ